MEFQQLAKRYSPHRKQPFYPHTPVSRTTASSSEPNRNNFTHKYLRAFRHGDHVNSTSPHHPPESLLESRWMSLIGAELMTEREPHRVEEVRPRLSRASCEVVLGRIVVLPPDSNIM
jgi:hypothetical protein